MQERSCQVIRRPEGSGEPNHAYLVIKALTLFPLSDNIGRLFFSIEAPAGSGAGSSLKGAINESPAGGSGGGVSPLCAKEHRVAQGRLTTDEVLCGAKTPKRAQPSFGGRSH